MRFCLSRFVAVLVIGTTLASSALANDLDQAFQVAFKNGDIQAVHGNRLQFKPLLILPLRNGLYVLLSLGTGNEKLDSDCSACDGAIRINYLSLTAKGFSLTSPHAEADLQGGSLGNPPDWTITSDTDSTDVAIEAYGSVMQRGEIDCWNVAYRLGPTGPMLDPALAKKMRRLHSCSSWN